MDSIIEVQPPASVLKDCYRLKSYFPYRIVWAAYNPAKDEWETGANPTMRQANDRLRAGCRVYKV